MKPLEWTSQDVVAYIRGILERDARERGAKVDKISRRRNRNKKNTVKVGHGGTLDPLATGVLVIGVGSGTKELQGYLSGSKKYTAGAELGYETTTLDLEGNVTRTAAFDHITMDDIEGILPQFTGKISQIPPLFSAIRKNGKKLYESAREGAKVEDVEIEAREVEIHSLKLIDPDSAVLPKFRLDVECGGGTYIRSLVRDIGSRLDSAANMIALERTQQAQFSTEDCITRDDWSADNIYAAIDAMNRQRQSEEVDAADEQ